MFNLKKIIIVVVVVVVAFIGYSYLISGKKSGSATGVTKQAVSTTATTASAASSVSLDGPGKEFVSQLLAIQNIRFNLALFSDPVFQGLQDWSREILPQESGRPNPFAPLDGDTSGNQPSSGAGFSGTISSDSAAPADGAGFASTSTATTGKTPVKPVPSRTSGATAR